MDAESETSSNYSTLNKIRGENTIRSLASQTKVDATEKGSEWEKVSLRSYVNKVPSFAINVREDGSCDEIINLSSRLKELISEK
jgi:hypothetical protein